MFKDTFPPLRLHLRLPEWPWTAILRPSNSIAETPDYYKRADTLEELAEG